ncbi:MAG: beta-propeller domain-containing protein, partial [Roseburia sp.]|nr:beta-propeller domain-containing protein [Roseburia sp.]
KSAETVEIPERISPEQIKNTLDLRAEWEASGKKAADIEESDVQRAGKAGEIIDEQERKVEVDSSDESESKQDSENNRKQEGGREQMEKKQGKQKKAGHVWQKIYRHGRRYGAVAAVFLLICGLGIFAAASGRNEQNGASQVADAGENAVGSSSVSGTEEGDILADYGQTETEDVAVIPEPKKDAGELYVVADNYGEVYDALEDMYRVTEEKYGLRDFVYDAVKTLTGSFYTSDDAAVNESVNMAVAGIGAAMEDGADTATSGTSGGSYSKTNLQTEGVDESDIIKTDGSYIYTVNGSSVYITDVRTKEMKAAGEITVAMNSASDQIREMYVDGNIVNLIVSKQESGLKESTTSENETAATDRICVDEVYYFDTNQVTELLTYDISNPKNPVLMGSVTQEGTYETSRKIGDVVYLFTNKYMSRPEVTRTAVMEDGGADGWIPMVDGKAIAADCIYIPDYGTAGLVVSSVNVQKPEEIVDNIMIINDNVEIYVSTTAIYLYGRNYDSSITTEIAKFSMDKGIFNAVGAANVPGEVYDTFAINEYQGRLRILTTDWSNGDDENNLYLLDEKLNMTGKLEGLAKGEQIYSARFFGNTAYFVTYRNTDPLFAVDLSDAANPKVLSELKITGFSEYLHFWGQDKLVGIGYETDPDTGRQLGMKMTMFDISNPADLKTAGTCVLENIDYSPALYNYKCVLVDEGENLIGFTGETYESDGPCSSYLLFSWENGAFGALMTETLAADVYLDNYRGLYIDDMFYLANPKGITSYDRTDGYKKVQKLDF